jgi:hypothetical protein
MADNTTTNNANALTVEQIQAVKTEIDELENKALQNAANKTLAAHYTRQYKAAKKFLKTAARLEGSAKERNFKEKMKAARGGGNSGGANNS